MISEDHSDIADWCNDAENSAMHHRNNVLMYIKKGNNYFKLQYFSFLWSNKCSLDEHETYPSQTLYTSVCIVYWSVFIH